VRRCMICTVPQGHSGDQTKEEWEKRSLCHIWWKRAVQKAPWEVGGGGGSRERDPLEYLGVDGRITSKWIL